MRKENRKQLNDKNNRKKGAYKSITYIIDDENRERQKEKESDCQGVRPTRSHF